MEFKSGNEMISGSKKVNHDQISFIAHFQVMWSASQHWSVITFHRPGWSKSLARSWRSCCRTATSSPGPTPASSGSWRKPWRTSASAASACPTHHWRRWVGKGWKRLRTAAVAAHPTGLVEPAWDNHSYSHFLWFTSSSSFRSCFMMLFYPLWVCFSL